MVEYKTEEIRFETFEELDEQLNTLRKKGWKPLLHREYDVEDGMVAWITFEVNE